MYSQRDSASAAKESLCLSSGFSLSLPLAVETIVVVVVEPVVAVAVGSIGMPHGAAIAVVVVAIAEVSQEGLTVGLRLGGGEGSAECLKGLKPSLLLIMVSWIY